MALGVLKGAWRSLLLRRLLPGDLHSTASLPLLLRGAQAPQAAPQRCVSYSPSCGAVLAPTAGEHLWSGLGVAACCEASADARTDARSARSPRAAEGSVRAGELPGAASALQWVATTQAGVHSDQGVHATTCLRLARPALAQQLRRSTLAEPHSTVGLPGAPCLWRRQQQRGLVNFLPGLNGDVSKQYHERRLIGCAPCVSLCTCRSAAAACNSSSYSSATRQQSQLRYCGGEVAPVNVYCQQQQLVPCMAL